MKGFDAFAGVIKSGGKTRRAAKMVILNIDHPDVVQFIECKAKEERKAWTLVEAGYDSSLDGAAYSSIFFQNANNSVRVTDEFMRAVESDGESGDDQRRSCLVDENGIDLVDDREIELALHQILEPEFHIVAQIIETEFVIGAVGDVACISLAAADIVEIGDDDADRQAEELVDMAHPFRIAIGQVIVDGHDVGAFALQRV